jgi:ABC-2 type transport system ATP-binding protein
MTATLDTRRTGGRLGFDGATNAIEVESLTKMFGEHAAVDQLTFSVPSGTIFGFLGPNGAGKTTTIGMMLGLIPPTSGTARIFGHDVKQELPDVLTRTGALVERPAFYPYLSGRTNITLFARQAGITDPQRIEEVLRIVDMMERADAKFGGYSTGMKQRIGIATALVTDPDLVILDEPTNGLDPAGQREIRALVRRLADTGHTVFLSSHILAEVQEVCTHVAIINRGKLVSIGRMEDILAGTEQLLIDVDRPDQAQQTLTGIDFIDAVQVQNGQILVDAPFEMASEINRILVENGFAVSQLRHREGRLEERFLELTGGAVQEGSNG